MELTEAIHPCIGGFSESDQNGLKLDPFILNRKIQGSRKPLTVIAHYREDLDNACLPSHTDFVPLVVSKLFSCLVLCLSGSHLNLSKF